MTKTLLVLLFLVGFFAGLALGIAWANSLGLGEINQTLDRIENAQKGSAG